MLSPAWREHTVGVIDAMVIMDARDKAKDVAVHNKTAAANAPRGKAPELKNLAVETGDAWPFVNEAMQIGLFLTPDAAEQGDDDDGEGVA